MNVMKQQIKQIFSNEPFSIIYYLTGSFVSNNEDDKDHKDDIGECIEWYKMVN